MTSEKSQKTGSFGLGAWIARRPVAVGHVAILVVIGVTYWTALLCGLVWDDEFVTTKSPYLSSLGGLRFLVTHDVWTASSLHEPSPYYRPVTQISNWLNYHLLGNSAFSYHAGSLLLHAASAIILFTLLRKTITKSVLPAALVSIWFALSPMGSEAVIWVAARCEPVGLCLSLSALVANRYQGVKYEIATLAITLLAILSKESFVLLPVLLLLQGGLVLEWPKREMLRRAASLVVIVGVYFWLRRLIGVPSAAAAASTVGIGEGLRSYAFIVATLVPRLFVPSGLDALRPYPHPALSLGMTIAVYGILGVISVLIVRFSRSDPLHGKVALFGWMFFLLALAPAALVGPLQGYLGDRYVYFPMLGIAWMLFSALSSIKNGNFRTTILFVFGALAVLQSILVMDRIGDWQNERSLFSASVERDPENGYALLRLGDFELLHGELENAEPHLVSARAANVDVARVEIELCVLYLQTARLEQAEQSCSHATTLEPGNPRAAVNLAEVFLSEGQFAKAENQATQAIHLKARYAEAYYVRGAARSKLGKTSEAVSDLDRALSIRPDHPQARNLREQIGFAAPNP